MSIREAAKSRVFCYVTLAVSIGAAAKPRVFCYVDVPVSIGEAGSALCKLCSTKWYWEVLRASFCACVVHSSTGKCFVQAL